MPECIYVGMCLHPFSETGLIEYTTMNAMSQLFDIASNEYFLHSWKIEEIMFCEVTSLFK